MSDIKMPPGTVEFTPDKRSGRLVLTTGPSGVGKTYQGKMLMDGFGRENVLWLSTELKVKTAESANPYVRPIVNVDFPRTAAEKGMCKSDVMAAFDWLRKEDHDIKVVFFDSIMRWSWKLLAHLKTTTFSEKGKVDTLRAFGIFGDKMKAFLDVISTLTDASVAKNPVHFVATWGTGVDIHPETGQRMHLPQVDGKMVQPIIDFHWDDVLRLEMDDKGRYIMHTKGRREFTCKVSSTDVVVEDVIVNPNLYEFIQLLEGGSK